MIRTAVALGRGTWAALRAPLWLGAGRLRRLLEAPGVPAGPGRDPHLALRAARGMVRLLSAPPRSPWRNTCLYRSVAECLVLRDYGLDARICIGVRDAPGPLARGAIIAHAWVSCPGSPGTEAHPKYLPLSR